MQLLHTNRVPTDVQKRDIINLIQVQEALRSDVEFEREELFRGLERTSRTLVEVSDMISDLQATLSPIKRMPDEILALIFEHSLPVRSPNEPFTVLSPSRNFAPIRPGLVCSSWRRVVHASPRLWCNVDLNLYGSTEIFTKTLPRLLSGICRSGSLPLILTFWFRHMVMKRWH
ncbi:hypothetical protein M405DRAFT_938534 [Rhizopogon salebrosus TDB-379]|nr:hypothetical protein M405DRAFT_938534 [Rhizopogon salebrosus TDB-379]